MRVIDVSDCSFCDDALQQLARPLAVNTLWLLTATAFAIKVLIPAHRVRDQSKYPPTLANNPYASSSTANAGVAQLSAA